ncbi:MULTISPECIES: NUDIX domain-containing protein [unclassified Mesorhizobium]|uniref:NUDIX hydrolase n=1 Tax=unclassified Mesorhizobium TaxID=325217 RepID=UPI0010930B9A|nr:MULTISPECIES: NUDIX domain-containing protein [unclassified Mesorhizobium]TGQ30721.1 NUDIX hydrolase [Mesorhizobium sp. M4B.F.Ca.ET.214.01.1.1]TGQ57229.1 NUDIX hydrolase [Mesorhizobium sp. M4B.F.Ca.ET.211.01.1.1]TGU30529.1 NUDIX hydrolase [Mesorhizobium sp. M4B.F.Ca.ET.150.01.1.1]
MSETDFLKDYDPSAFQRPSVAVDLVLLGLRDGRPTVLLLRRDQHPHAGRWALPGGFVGIDESLDAVAARVLREKAAIEGARIEQLYTFGAVDRDPRMRIISVANLVLLTEEAFEAAIRAMPALLPAAIHVPWTGEAGGAVNVLSLDNEKLTLAFDHADILAMAMLRLRGKLDYSDVAFALLPELFTLRQLQDVHEAILGTSLNKPAFRRRLLDKGWLTATGAYEAGTAYRPAELYRFQRP